MLQHNTSNSSKFHAYTDPPINVHGGGAISHPTQLIFFKSNTTGPIDANFFMRLDDTCAYLRKVLFTAHDIQLGGIFKSNRTDET